MITGMGLLYMLLVGLIIGFIASAIMGDGGFGLIWSIVLGIVGSLVGSFAVGLFGFTAYGLLGQIIVGIIGACIVLFIAGLVRGRRTI